MTKIINFFDGYETATQPSIINITTSNLNVYASDAAYVTAEGAAISGSIYNNSTAKSVRYYDGVVWRELLDLSNTQILSNKSFSGPTDFTGDVTITGDLTVTGNTVTINVIDLTVQDPNIIINKGGTQDTAVGGGITLEVTDGTDAKITYDNSLTSKFKIGNSGSEAEVVTTSNTQSITNKDIDGGTASNSRRITTPKDTKSNLDALTRKEATIVYATDEKKIYVDDGSILLPVGNNFEFSGSYAGTSALTGGVTVSSGTWEAETNGNQVAVRVILNLAGASDTDYVVTSIELPTGAPTPKAGLYFGMMSATDPNPSSNDTMDTPITLKYIGGMWKLLGSDSVLMRFATSNPAIGYLSINYTKN